MQLIILPETWTPKLLDTSREPGMFGGSDIMREQLKLIDPNFEAQELKMGKRYTWTALLVTLKIELRQSYFPEDRIEQKIAIGKRILSIISNCNAVLLDKEASKLIALAFLADKFTLHSFRLKEEKRIIIDNASSNHYLKKEPEDFKANPWCIYLLTYVINDRIEIMLSVRSDVEIKELYSYEIS